MKSKLNQELQKQTKVLISKTFPDSAPFKPEKFPRDWQAWRLNQNNELHFFLILAPSPKDDSFALEIAWSIHARLPEFSVGNPEDDSGKGEICFRLSRLWQKYGMEHRWYLGAIGSEPYNLRDIERLPEMEHCSMESILARPENKELAERARELGINMIPPKPEPFEQKLASVKPQIEDAFAKLRQYGIPYLKQIGSRYGVKWELPS